MQTLVGSPEPEDPRDFLPKVENEFRQLDAKLAQARAAMELARGLVPRVFPRDVN